MGFNRLALAILFSLSGAVLTRQLSAEPIYSDKVTAFEFKPQVCIVKKIGDECELLTTVNIETTDAIALCLVKEDESLRCWQDKKSIREKLALVLQQSTTIALLDEDKQLLASEQLQVNAVNPKQKRRRLRPAWSLF